MSRSEKFWDRAANTYDQDDFITDQANLYIIEKTKTYLKPDNLVLEFGSGTGGITLEIAGAVRAVQALDTSEKMIELAKAKAGRRRVENIDYAHSTLFDARYAAGSVDAILAFYVLHLIEDTSQVLRRIHELLKPAGLFISATPCTGGKALLEVPLFLAGKIGLIPKVRTFKIADLEAAIDAGNFKIIETECLRQKTQEYFMVAKKN